MRGAASAASAARGGVLCEGTLVGAALGSWRPPLWARGQGGAPMGPRGQSLRQEAVRSSPRGTDGLGWGDLVPAARPLCQDMRMGVGTGLGGGGLEHSFSPSPSLHTARTFIGLCPPS